MSGPSDPRSTPSRAAGDAAGSQLPTNENAKQLRASLRATILGTGLSAASSLIRIPLTISTVGVAAYGVINTIGSLFTWVAMIPVGARQAASAAIAVDNLTELEDIASLVTRATFRRTFLIAAALCVAVLVAPVGKVVDPGGSMSTMGLRLALWGGIAIGFLSIAGSARLGALTTLGNFRAQNLATVASVVVLTAATIVASALHLPPPLFAIVWCCALAGPALAVPGRLRGRGRRQRQGSATNYGTLSATSIWMTVGQQVASGFDLVILSVTLGSAAAADYGLWTRLLLLSTTPTIGAVPVLTRLAGTARSEASDAARGGCKRAYVIVGAGQLITIIGLGITAEFAMGLLSGHKLQVSPLLLASGVAWAALECLRRTLVAATSTSVGLRTWKHAGLWLAIPNVALSVLLARSIGVSGPMLASVLCFILSMAWAVPKLRGELVEVLA